MSEPNRSFSEIGIIRSRAEKSTQEVREKIAQRLIEVAAHLFEFSPMTSWEEDT